MLFREIQYCSPSLMMCKYTATTSASSTYLDWTTQHSVSWQATQKAMQLARHNKVTKPDKLSYRIGMARKPIMKVLLVSYSICLLWMVEGIYLIDSRTHVALLVGNR